MTAFALNSVLTRLALVSDSIGPSNFATLRAASGALTLILLEIEKIRGGKNPPFFIKKFI